MLLSLKNTSLWYIPCFSIVMRLICCHCCNFFVLSDSYLDKCWDVSLQKKLSDVRHSELLRVMALFCSVVLQSYRDESIQDGKKISDQWTVQRMNPEYLFSRKATTICTRRFSVLPALQKGLAKQVIIHPKCKTIHFQNSKTHILTHSLLATVTTVPRVLFL